MSMILLEPAYKILHPTVKFKRRTISVNPVFRALRRWERTGSADAHASTAVPIAADLNPITEPTASPRQRLTDPQRPCFLARQSR
jgi:hypothetical protein